MQGRPATGAAARRLSEVSIDPEDCSREIAGTEHPEHVGRTSQKKPSERVPSTGSLAYRSVRRSSGA